MHDHETRFRSSQSPEDVLDEFRRLSDEKGWKVVSEDEGTVRAQSGATLRAAGEDMEVSAQPEGAGSFVRVAVKSRLGLLQLIDWGEARALHGEIAARLQALGQRRSQGQGEAAPDLATGKGAIAPATALPNEESAEGDG